MNKRIVYIVLLLYSCQHNESTQKEYYDDGILKSEVSLINGSRHGVSKYFDLNGKLETLERWKHGKLDGITELYFSSGKVKKEILYVGDTINNDFYREYYENGQLKVDRNLSSRITKFYYSNGHLMEKQLRNVGDSVVDFVKYNQFGVIRDDIILNSFLDFSEDTIKIGKKLEIDVNNNSAEFINSDLIVSIYNHKKLVVSDTVKPLDRDLSYFEFRYKPLVKGSYDIEFYFIDTIYSDTTFLYNSFFYVD